MQESHNQIVVKIVTEERVNNKLVISGRSFLGQTTIFLR